MRPTLRVSIDDKWPSWAETLADWEKYEAVCARAIELDYTGMGCGWYTPNAGTPRAGAPRGQFMVRRNKVEAIIIEAEDPMAAVEVMGIVLAGLRS